MAPLFASSDETAGILVAGNVVHSIVRRKKVNKKDKLMLVFFMLFSC